jgi:hypothetical protein
MGETGSHRMVVDLERIKENRLKFLAALYEIAAENVAKENVHGGITLVLAYEAVIGERAGLTRQEADQIGTDLLHEKIVNGCSGDGVNGPQLNLTHEGKRLVEEYLYEKSFLAKRRKWKAWLKEKSASGAGSMMKEAGKWLGGIVIGAAGASYGPVIMKLVKELLRVCPIRGTNGV